MGERKISPLYRLIKAAVQAVYPKIKVVGRRTFRRSRWCMWATTAR